MLHIILVCKIDVRRECMVNLPRNLPLSQTDYEKVVVTSRITEYDSMIPKSEDGMLLIRWPKR